MKPQILLTAVIAFGIIGFRTGYTQTQTVSDTMAGNFDERNFSGLRLGTTILRTSAETETDLLIQFGFQVEQRIFSSESGSSMVVQYNSATRSD